MTSRTKLECDVEELRRALEKGDACMVDVRELAEFRSIRIPQATLIPLGQLEQRAAEIERSNPVYVICRTGRRSAEAQRKLAALGFSNVINVCGGIASWQDRGFPVVRDANAPWSLERQVRFAAGSLVLVGVLLSVLVAQPLVWVAGFVGAGLVFAAVTDTCAMGMMLARLPWNRQ